MRTYTLYFFIVLPLSLFLASCSKKDPDTHEHPESFTGADFYMAHCAECHLSSGMGKVLAGIPAVFYSEMTHSGMRKFIMSGASPDDNHHQFNKMPKSEARKITQHVDSLFVNKLKEKKW